MSHSEVKKCKMAGRWALLLCLALLPIAASAAPKTHRVLFAVSSPDAMDWQIVVRNIPHVLSGFAPDKVEIEVVAFGPGIAMLKSSSPVRDDIAQLQKQGVRFVACETAMRAFHLQLSDLVPGAQTTPSGIVEVIRRQEQGWTYIKGGR